MGFLGLGYTRLSPFPARSHYGQVSGVAFGEMVRHVNQSEKISIKAVLWLEEVRILSRLTW